MFKLMKLACASLLVCGAIGCQQPQLGTAASDGIVEVHYVTGRVGKVAFAAPTLSKGQKPPKEPQIARVSDKELLQIRISIENKSGQSKLQYKGWGGGDSLTGGSKAVLKDDLGNTYKPVSFGIMRKPAGQREDESLYPGSVVDDVLVFEVPVAKASLMHLVLPRRNYLPNLSGPVALELAIPTSTFDITQ